MVVIAAGVTPNNPVDRFTCYSGINSNFSVSIFVVTAVGTPPCANSTQGNGRVVYFNYGLPGTLLITGLAANSNYQIKIFAVKNTGIKELRKSINLI